jgi:hypothetical protein
MPFLKVVRRIFWPLIWSIPINNPRIKVLPKMELITDPALITHEWLTEALKAGGLLPAEGRVLSADWENIGTGKMGDNARFRLCYDGNYKAPCTLIAKLPAADETARAVAGGMGAYRKEVMFYKELAGVAQIGRR